MKHKRSVLISPIFSPDSIIAIIVRYRIEKLVLLVDKQIKNEQRESIEKLRQTFGKALSIDQKEIELFNIVDITTRTIEIIREYQNDYEIILNISTGKRTQAFGMIYGSTIVAEHVERIIYYDHDTAEMIEFPVLCHGLSEVKGQILRYLNKNESIEKIHRETGKSKSMIYSHIRDLKEKGYLDEEGNLTEIGQILVH